MKWIVVCVVALLGLAMGGAAAALEADQVRGEVVEVNAQESTVTLRIVEAGEDRSERTGDVETYELADHVEIQRVPAGQDILHGVAVGEPGVADLFAGDELVIGFEDAEGRETARHVTVSEGPRPGAEGAEIAPFEGDEKEER